MRSDWRPRYIVIARCRVGAPLAFVARSNSDRSLLHKGEPCAQGVRNLTREIVIIRNLRVVPSVTSLRR
jgi:precorrin-6B methylase 1